MVIYYLVFLFGIITFLLSIYNSEIEVPSKDLEDLSSTTKETVPEKIIVLFKGDPYDITSFVKKHPGGKDILIQHANEEISQLMADNEHSDAAYKILNKYKVVNPLKLSGSSKQNQKF